MSSPPPQGPGVRNGSKRAQQQSPNRQHASGKPRGRSVFREEVLNDLDSNAASQPGCKVAASSQKCQDVQQKVDKKGGVRPASNGREFSWYMRIHKSSRSLAGTYSNGHSGFSTLPRLVLIALLIAVAAPCFARSGNLVGRNEAIQGRENSSVNVCTRWAHQAANVNGTLYIYGGQATMEARQTSNTWNDNFLVLDLTKTWQIAAPAISGLPRPSGPPPISEGYLWHTSEALFLYGGEFSDKPSTSPLPVSTWEYRIATSTWIEYPEPETSAGNNSDGGGFLVQRAAEGAGLSVPELGKSWYFGGHLDSYTSPGFSNQIPRIYLKSLLEFTHPGYANTAIYSLGSLAAAGSGGVYRNITKGGLEADAGFTERADGVLAYIPGWGDEGILLGLAGGTNETFTEMNVIDVFDIASSTWYKQSTSGTSPPIRVNPCAVVVSAADGSSFNVYLYGGQNLLPFGNQIQYSDMWILTIPSFTWIEINLEGQSQPPARAGHTCNIWDGQIVVVGGYVGKDISCDSPGIYVFNASSLQWINEFTAVPSGIVDQDSSFLRGSLGYQVPSVVQSIVGGSGSGGATATMPAAGRPTVGPFATGNPPTITVTKSGATIIQTSQSTATVSLPAPHVTNDSLATKPEPNIGAITAGVAAAIFALLAAYLAFCSWLYRRQLKLYENHVAMAQRTGFSPNQRAWRISPGSADGSRRHSNENNDDLRGGAMMLGSLGTTVTGRTSGADGSATVSSAASPGLLDSSGGARASEADEEVSDYLITSSRSNNWPLASGITAHSSMEDLLGGQEPSFFSVVLNPRRTLRVVNSD